MKFFSENALKKMTFIPQRNPERCQYGQLQGHERQEGP